MATTPYTQLFPQLPPELRQQIYTHTLTNPPSSSGLPFATKQYSTSHTTVTITPIHHGNPSLLALTSPSLSHPPILEAHEYTTHLLTHALTLRISLVFKGNTQHFIPHHWTEKMSTHVKNLVKKYPWVSRIPRYDINILWTPIALPRSTKKVADLGGIVRGMVNVLTSGMESEVARKRGDVSVKLHVGDWVAAGYVGLGRGMGLGPFMRGGAGEGVKRQVRGVYLAPKDRGEGDAEERDLPSHLNKVKKFETKLLMVEGEDGTVEWTGWTRGELVFSKEVVAGERGAEISIKTGMEEHQLKEWRLSKAVYFAMSCECRAG